jgi:hypothetical protein
MAASQADVVHEGVVGIEVKASPVIQERSRPSVPNWQQVTGQ